MESSHDNGYKFFSRLGNGANSCSRFGVSGVFFLVLKAGVSYFLAIVGYSENPIDE